MYPRNRLGVSSLFLSLFLPLLRHSFDDIPFDTLSLKMYCFRRAATRLFSSSSTSILGKPRSITTITPPALRLNRQLPRSAFQRRWASDETAKEPTPETKDVPTSADRADEQVVESAVKATSTEPTEPEVTEWAEAVAQAGNDAAPETRAPRVEDAEKQRRTPIPQPDPKETVYVGNLFYDVSAEDLKRQMEKFGIVENVRIVHDNRGLSKGFGYVTFDSVEAATRAIEGMHMQIFEGRRIVAHYAQNNFRPPKKGRNAPSKTLFIGNISFDLTDRDLNDIFRNIHNVIDVRVAVDRRTGQPRGFAHADFIDIPSAEAALAVLSSKAPYGRRLRVDFSHSNKARESLPQDRPSQDTSTNAEA